MDRLQVTILIVCIHFVVLTLPEFINVIFTYLVNKYNLLEYSFTLEAKQILTNTICGSLEHLFLSAKIFIYFFSSPEFRDECRKLFCGCCLKRSKIDDQISDQTSFHSVAL